MAGALSGTEIAPANTLLAVVALLALAFGVALVMPTSCETCEVIRLAT
ncbi:MAG: hypothetical protein AAB295_01665 [Chloroflexota bacterium]